jgi:hypothetical protein
MLDFRILGFYVRPPEPQSPWSLLAATDAPHPKCVIWHLGGADSTAGLALRDT